MSAMRIDVQYKKSADLYVARLVDDMGPLGVPVAGKSAVDAAFHLGHLYGTRPQEFTRTIEEYDNAGVPLS
jgi:hypothetical protein